MKHLIFVFLVMGSVMFFFSCQEESAIGPEINQNDQSSITLAKKPAAKLVGTTFANFTFTPPTFWNGTIDFGTEGVYGLTFISHGGKEDNSQASTFSEDFIIYELGTDWTVPDNVYLRGWNKGVVTFANKAPDPVNFHANGKIEEAYGPFEMWQDRIVHIKGVVVWQEPGVPQAALGTFRIN